MTGRKWDLAAIAAAALLQGCAAVADGTPAGPDTRVDTPGDIALEMVAEGTALEIDVRGRRIPARVVPLPFVPHRYHR